jgi:hypothetical protein
MRMNKIARTNVRLAYHRLLDGGFFPEVGWKRGECYSYNTFQYTQFWGRMAHLVDAGLRARGYHMGCYEMKRSDRFRSEVIEIIHSITPDMIAQCTRMFGVPRAF